MRFLEPSCRPLRKRCRFRISEHRDSWPSLIAGGYLSRGAGVPRLLPATTPLDQLEVRVVERELWWAGYNPRSSTLRHFEVRR